MNMRLENRTVYIITANKKRQKEFSDILSHTGCRIEFFQSIRNVPRSQNPHELDVAILEVDREQEPHTAAIPTVLAKIGDSPLLLCLEVECDALFIQQVLDSGTIDLIDLPLEKMNVLARIYSAIRMKDLLINEKKIRKELICHTLELEERVEKRTRYLKESITHIKEHYRDREQLLTQLANSKRDHAVASMSEGLAHSFNNLLQIIVGHISLLRFNSHNKDVKNRSLNAIETATDHAALLIQQLMSYTKNNTCRPEPIRVDRLLRHTVSSIHPEYKGRIHPIDLSCESLPPVMGHGNDLHFALYQLIINAIEAMPDGGDVCIETRHRTIVSKGKGEGIVEIAVMDTGVGMDESTLQRIFEPFFSTKIENLNTGMGLAIVNKIMDTHQGRITVSSTPGEGSIFTLELPVCRDDESSKESLVATEAEESKVIKMYA
jgi:signal transduction histidine kinase